MLDNEIEAVHVHTNIQQSAKSTWATLPAAEKSDIFWLYVPVRGVITKFGMKKTSRRFPAMKQEQGILVSSRALEYSNLS